ncbi:MAG: hypothetical protein KGO96_07540 [Elusimicrobia bacterium]|nr:hypothetical protein [Elusimicrobiota bacterium]
MSFLHIKIYEVLIKLKIDFYLVSSSDWRKTLELRLSKDDKKNNKKVNEAKRSNKSKKELGLKGKITWKHLSVRMVNELFGLNLRQKENDQSDAILLGLAYIKGAKICEGK